MAEDWIQTPDLLFYIPVTKGKILILQNFYFLSSFERLKNNLEK